MTNFIFLQNAYKMDKMARCLELFEVKICMISSPDFHEELSRYSSIFKADEVTSNSFTLKLLILISITSILNSNSFKIRFYIL